MKASRLQGRLLRTPFPERPAPATTKSFPLKSVSDFEAAAAFVHDDAPAPLLMFAEHFEVLAALVAEAQRQWPELAFILIRLNLPGACRLAAPLLDEKVFLTLDLAAERAALEAKGVPYLAIDDDFRRVLAERGHNRIALHLSAPDAWHEKLSNLGALLATFGVEVSR